MKIKMMVININSNCIQQIPIYLTKLEIFLILALMEIVWWVQEFLIKLIAHYIYFLVWAGKLKLKKIIILRLFIFQILIQLMVHLISKEFRVTQLINIKFMYILQINLIKITSFRLFLINQIQIRLPRKFDNYKTQ